MARFRILESRNAYEPERLRSRFRVHVIDGNLVVGDQFRLYETHHYTDYTVCSVEPSDNHCVVYAEPELWYDGWNEGAILDTNDLEAGHKYGYSGPGKYLYHPDAIKALDDEQDEERIEGPTHAKREWPIACESNGAPTGGHPAGFVDEKGEMETRLLSEPDFRATFSDQMVDIMGREDALTPQGVLDLIPYVAAVPSDDLLPHVLHGHFVRYVFRSSDARFDHVLYLTETDNVYLVIVVDLTANRVKGHHILDLNQKHGITGQGVDGDAGNREP